VYFIGRGLL